MKNSQLSPHINTTHELVRVKGKLKEIVIVKDKEGKVLHKIMSPLMVEFYMRDVLQVIIGATLLAIPIAFTEEVWSLGIKLPMYNVAIIGLLSVLFMGFFTYYNFYREGLNGHVFQFLKRVISTYVLSFIVVAIILTLIDKANWSTDYFIAIKRVIIVAFPASMSAAIADVLK